jgi:hypothetical protein
LTEKGRNIRTMLNDLFARHTEGFEARGIINASGMEDINQSLKRMERYWTDQIRYIY